METKRKSNSVVTVQQDGTVLVFDVMGAGRLAFDVSNANAACRQHAEMHGWKQRISDAAAMSRDPETGKPATAQEKLAAMRELVEHYESGSAEWSRVGGGGGGRSLTVEAIARVKGCDYDAAEAAVAKFAGEKYEGDTKKALAYLRQGERVAAAMEAIRRERAPQPKLDADKALADL